MSAVPPAPAAPRPKVGLPTCKERLDALARQHSAERRRHLDEDALRSAEDAKERAAERFNWRLLVGILLTALVGKIIWPVALFHS